MDRVNLGYKLTELGIVPSDWLELPLGFLVTKVGSGITPRGGSKVYQHFGRPFVRSQNIGWGRLILDDIAFIDDETHRTFAGSEITKGDVFLNITGASIGRSAVADERVVAGNVNQHVCIIRPILESLDPLYLCYFLLSHIGQRQITSFQAGGNRQGLNFGQIKSFKLAIPPTIDEQRAIVEVLSDIDASIEATEALIAKKRAGKLGVMQELLTGKKRLAGFIQDWEVRSFDELFMFLQTANNPRSDFSERGEVEYIHYGDIHVRWTTFFDSKSGELPRITSDKVRNVPYVQEGDLVIVDASEDYNGIGASIEIKAIGDRKIVAGLHTLLLRGDKDLLSNGFKGYLQYIPEVKNAVIKAATGISVYGISKNNVKRISVCIPNIREQEAIALILSDIDEEIIALEAQRDKTTAIKQGMTQELLTGKTRLI